MKERELNRANIGVAKTTAMSGRATADEINCDLWTAKGSKLWRIACLTFLGFLTVAGLFFAVTPLPVRADNDEDSGHGHEDNDKGIRAEFTALQAQVAALQSAVSTLQTANSDQQNEIKSLQTSNAKLQNQVNSLQTSNTTMQKQLAAVQSNHALALGPYVSVDPNPENGVIGPNIKFTGANIHILSGSGATDDNFFHGGSLTGLGNLIIGYDEAPASLSRGERDGSHNLIIGAGHRFLSNVFGGLLAGENNSLFAAASSIVGGSFNSVGIGWGSILGGQFNRIGQAASGSNATIVGGQHNIVYGDFASVLGGDSNTAGGFASSVLGGQGNNIIGGPSTNFSIAPQPPFP
jgi:hypothetical protein